MHPERYWRWVLILIALALVHLYVYTKNVGLNYDCETLKEQFNALYSENHFLASEVSYLSRLDRIEDYAKTKLDMEYPAKITYLIVSQEAGLRAGASTPAR